MGVHADHWIQKMVEKERMIDPFEPSLVRENCISYGCSSYGYDMRLASEFRIPTHSQQEIIDPKEMSETHFTHLEATTYILPSHGFVMARSIEYFRIPRNILTLCFGKSTYARAGILVNLTPFEPEWEGTVTFSIFNLSNRPAKIYAGEGIAQVLFLEAAELCHVSYADRKGKYQKQDRLTLSKL